MSNRPEILQLGVKDTDWILIIYMSGQGYISQAVGKYFMWRKMFILGESVRILQRYLNILGLMEKNERTYRCSNTNYTRNVSGSSLDRISGYLYWGFSWFSSVSEKNAMMVLACMTHIVLPSTSWFQRLFVTMNNISFIIGETCVSALKSLDKYRRQTFPVCFMKAYMGSNMAPLIPNLGTR